MDYDKKVDRTSHNSIIVYCGDKAKHQDAYTNASVLAVVDSLKDLLEVLKRELGRTAPASRSSVDEQPTERIRLQLQLSPKMQ